MTKWRTVAPAEQQTYNRIFIDCHTFTMQTIEINREPVELYKILKFEGLVGTGGEAKIVIDEGMVKVNGQVELRRRNKIKSGDVIEFNGEQYSIVLMA